MGAECATAQRVHAVHTHRVEGARENLTTTDELAHTQQLL